MKLSKGLSVVIMSSLLASGNLYAGDGKSVWKKILKISGISLGATTAVVSIGTVAATVAAAKDPGATSQPQSNSDNAQTSEPQSRSDQSRSQSRQQAKAQGVLIQLQEEYVFFLNDYANAVARGENLDVENIKQPFLKEFYLNILSDEALVAEIEQSIEGATLIEKLNKVLASEMF